ncbi:metallophosphoesterase [Deinococcus radiophilus]|uniref:metallophosphoesterase n=1 Tax=Deinococcus radiophilus TaxID=32062 RepID=UPI001E5D9923|nr:metallophosphoesterase [Deinococcus radiophilus]UFA50165.1 metallophosphoesterase [Deinococcus radiophilus]
MSESRTVFVVPDLHGRADLLEAAVRYAEAHWPNWHLLNLGDAIDRGPHSLRCVARLLELRKEGRATLLMGNHERMALEGPQHFSRFQQSANPQDLRLAMQGMQWWMRAGGESVRRELGGLTLEQFPELMREYLQDLPRMVFVDGEGEIHAELPAAPSVMVTHASPPKAHRDYPDPMSAVLWLRPTDGLYELPTGVTYSVHGHTPVRVVIQQGKQVYLDLAAYKTGRLALLPLQVDGPRGLVVLEGEGNRQVAETLPAFGHMLPAELARV